MLLYIFSLVLSRPTAIVFVLKNLYSVIVVKLSFGFFNGRFGQIRKGLTTTRAAI